MKARKTRVCYVLNCFGMGGAETVALDLARGHDPDRYEVEVVAALEPKADEMPEMRRRFIAAGVKTVVIHQDSFRSPMSLLRFYSYLVRGRFDVVLGHNRGSDYWAVKLGWLAGVKHRFWTRHLTYQDMSPRLIHKYQSIVGITDRVLAVSDAVHKACVETEGLPPSKVVTVVNGIDMKKFSPLEAAVRHDIRRKLGVGAGEKILLFVGRFSEQKAPEAFVDLVHQVRVTDPAVRGFMCGHGPLEQELRSRASVDDGVEVLGLRSDIPALLGACDLFVSTSRNEGLPLNVMEAMSVGAAFVGPGIPQIGELVSGEPLLEAQLFVAPPAKGPVGREVISQWCGKVHQCLGDLDRLQEVGLCSRDVIARKFSLKQMVDRYEALFSAAASGSL